MNATSKNTGRNLASGKGPWYLLGVLAVTIATIAGSGNVQAGDPKDLGPDVQIALRSTDAAPQPSIKRTKSSLVERKSPIWDGLFSNWEPAAAGPALNLSLDGFDASDVTAGGELQSARLSHIKNCYDTAAASLSNRLHVSSAGQAISPLAGFNQNVDEFYDRRVHSQYFVRCMFER